MERIEELLELSESSKESAQAFMELAEELQPVMDAADGMRAELERRGWSPTMAETIAGKWLESTLVQICQG